MMKTLISLNNITNLSNTPYYADLCCECQTIKFYMVISQLGVIHLTFTAGDHRQAIIHLKQQFPEMTRQEVAGKTSFCSEFFKEIISGKMTPPDFEKNPFLKNATAFQKKAWLQISKLKAGETITYEELATATGSPGGARAAGRACNKNPLALLIPCHRVVAARDIGGFAADLSIKKRLLELEKSYGK